MTLLVVTIVAALVVALSAYALHRRIAPNPPKSPDKLAPYACGEYLPPERVPIRVLFFKYACLFLILDVVALLLAFTLGSPPPPQREVVKYLALTYGLVALAAIALAVTE